MKDWKTLQPDKIKLIQKHYTQGRAGAKVEFVVLHHLAGIGRTADVWDWWQTRQASAHYVVEIDGLIGQLVWDRDTAWANANTWANQRAITIEHCNSAVGDSTGWPISDKTLEEGSHLVAAVCVYYGLGRPKWNVNVFPHSKWGSTSCPHQLDTWGWYHDIYMERAGEWYDIMTGDKHIEDYDMTLSEEDLDRIKAINDAETERTVARVKDFITAFVGPIGSDVKDVREQLTGGRDAGEYSGWPQLGYDTEGNALTVVDAISATRHDIATLDRKVGNHDQ